MEQEADEEAGAIDELYHYDAVTKFAPEPRRAIVHDDEAQAHSVR